MPRRQFNADLYKAKDDIKPLGILDIKAGDDDGQLEIEYDVPGAGDSIVITALVPDVSEYPKSHEYMIFCGEDAPHHIGKALQNVRSTERKTVFELIDIISTTLASLAPDADGDIFMHDSQADDELEDEDEDGDEDYEYPEEDDPFAFGQPRLPTSTTFVATTNCPELSLAKDWPFRQRVRADLRAAKAAGFRVGQLGHLLDGYNAFVTVSIRISKLGISEEAMQAWGLEPSEYVILIIQYPNGYKTNEQLQSYDSLRLKPNVGMRVYAGKKYKPTLQEAIRAFTTAYRDMSAAASDKGKDTRQDSSSIRDTFISKPVTALLEEILVPILRFRSTGMDWHGAESWYNDSQGVGAQGDPNAIPDRYYAEEENNKALPSVVTDDHYARQDVIYHSFPLLAMQFLLRHFVRCTEFCLVCHRKMASELEAIKPYVCDNPLCLFQYMAMGFGPSIEHEIMAQPYVVDLLVSFCYSSARSHKLKDFPDGLALMVPPLSSSDITQYQSYSYDPYDRQKAEKPAKELPGATHYEVGFDQERLELIFFDKPEGGCPVARGSWVVLKPATTDGPRDELHCRVVETTFFPTLMIDEPVVVKKAPKAGPGEIPTPKDEKPEKQIAIPAVNPRYVDATFTTYSQDFEELDSAGKCVAICKLLDTLPSVKDMQDYLSNRHPADLKSWVQRMSPAAISLLRWIIASNRACIMQVDGGSRAAADGQALTSRKQERLYGMDGFMQFRFAMGAPDKEQRFLSEVRNTSNRLNLKYPTIFAWHGSPIFNWHMIIREGLHYKNVDHGRAYGNGVYHAKDASTSTGYSGGRGMYGNIPADAWPSSVLNVSSALALNEIVNATAEFTSHNPYYVVPQLDWIQTRYLFVSCSPAEGSSVASREEREPVIKHVQDPQRTPTGTNGKPIQIPASAIKSGNLVKKQESFLANPMKKLKGALGDPIVIDGDEDAAGSEEEATDVEDLEIFFDESEPAPIVAVVRKDTPAVSMTDFVPNALDFATLPLMPLPTYATSGTTKRLLTELRNLTWLQESTPSAELGWHISTDKIENVYQWIVELHSFHTFTPELPLSKDMKSQNVKSIVLEIRFGSDFPFSPPYIRVVRPHFLSFAQGGGGHIVIGGAMCMELLTSNGWSSVLGMDSVLLQVRMAIASEPHARLDKHGRGDYCTAEAAEGYLRACRTHGWTAPEGFKEVAMGGPVGNEYV